MWLEFQGNRPAQRSRDRGNGVGKGSGIAVLEELVFKLSSERLEYINQKRRITDVPGVEKNIYQDTRARGVMMGLRAL